MHRYVYKKIFKTNVCKKRYEWISVSYSLRSVLSQLSEVVFFLLKLRCNKSAIGWEGLKFVGFFSINWCYCCILFFHLVSWSPSQCQNYVALYSQSPGCGISLPAIFAAALQSKCSFSGWCRDSCVACQDTKLETALVPKPLHCPLAVPYPQVLSLAGSTLTFHWELCQGNRH